jgi:hypothetical protein
MRSINERTLASAAVAAREVDQGELERLSSALRLAESALEEALEAAENLGNFDHRFDVPRAIGGAQRLVQNANEAVDAARKP